MTDNNVVQTAGLSDNQQRLNTVQQTAVGGRSPSAKSYEVSQNKPTQNKPTRWKNIKQVKVATWNVRTLYQAGKLANLILETKRLNIDILGISEVRWTGYDQISVDNYKLFYSGGDRHERGVGILVKKDIGELVDEVIPMSDRIIAIRLMVRPKPIFLIQVYAPTTDSEDEHVEAFYEELEKVMRKTRSDCPVIILGDFNAKIGSGAVSESVGAFGLGIQNERGARLIEFAERKNMVLCNTLYKKHPRRLYTWKSPGDQTRNQIDYVLINQRYRNLILNCTTYPSADCNTDHILLVASCRLRLRKKVEIQRNKTTKRIDMEQLKKKSAQFSRILEGKAEQVGNEEGVENQWQAWKTAVKETLKETIGEPRTRKKRKLWMTDEILDRMDERRRITDRNSAQYKEANKRIVRMCQEAKGRWFEEKCQQIEKLEEEGKMHEMHKETKWMRKTQKKKRSKLMKIEDEHGEIQSSIEKVNKIWMNYVQKLYNDERRPENMEIKENIEEAPEITLSELEFAIKKAKPRKAVGMDEIDADVLKHMSVKSKRTLLNIINHIYRTGVIPADFEVSTFVPIPKKNTAKKCS